MFQVGDKIKFNECPFTKEKDIKFYNNIINMVHVVMETDGQFVKTNLVNDWVHRNWFHFYSNDEYDKLRQDERNAHLKWLGEQLLLNAHVRENGDNT